MAWLWLSAATMALTALAHSFVGEKRLIGPILALDRGIIAHPLARQVLRFAWHLTSALMLVTAVLVVRPRSEPVLIFVTGAVWLAAGLIDAIYTRGRHFGWPTLTLAGAFAMVGSGA